MSSKPNYLDFLNPAHMIWRKGTTDDPFVDRVEVIPVINQRLQLLEIPDKLHRVKISNLREINYKTYIKRSLNEDEFYVDYSNGMVFVHRKMEARTVTVTYKGRGVILYPSSRIYHHDTQTDVVSNLDNIIQEALDRIDEMLEHHVEMEKLKNKLLEAIVDNNINADNLRIIIEQALIAIDLVEDAYKTTKLIFKPYVNTYSEIKDDYPFPRVGWTVQVYDTGIRYRWDGAEWTPIDILGGNIPPANENVDGLFTKENFVKLEGITDKVDTRVIVFILPQEVLSGVQDPHIVFPFDGEIIHINASLSGSGSADTAIRLEKSVDYDEWFNLTPDPIRILAGEHFDDESYTISDTVVNAGDIFRLYVPYSSDVVNLTLNIKIKL